MAIRNVVLCIVDIILNYRIIISILYVFILGVEWTCRTKMIFVALAL